MERVTVTHSKYNSNKRNSVFICQIFLFLASVLLAGTSERYREPECVLFLTSLKRITILCLCCQVSFFLLFSTLFCLVHRWCLSVSHCTFSGHGTHPGFDGNEVGEALLTSQAHTCTHAMQLKKL